MSIDEACGATSPEGDKQQMGVFQQPVKQRPPMVNHSMRGTYSFRGCRLSEDWRITFANLGL
jgi:hypothetical protein